MRGATLRPSARDRDGLRPLPPEFCRSFRQRPVDLDSVPLRQRHQSRHMGRGRRLRDRRRLIQNKTFEPGWRAHHKHPDRPLADRLEPVRNITRPVHKSARARLQPFAAAHERRLAPHGHKSTRPPDDACDRARQIPPASPCARSFRTLHSSFLPSPSSASERLGIGSRRLLSYSDRLLLHRDHFCSFAAVLRSNWRFSRCANKSAFFNGP